MLQRIPGQGRSRRTIIGAVAATTLVSLGVNAVTAMTRTKMYTGRRGGGRDTGGGSGYRQQPGPGPGS